MIVDILINKIRLSLNIEKFVKYFVIKRSYNDLIMGPRPYHF